MQKTRLWTPLGLHARKMAPVTLLTSVDITHLLKAWEDGDESAFND